MKKNAALSHILLLFFIVFSLTVALQADGTESGDTSADGISGGSSQAQVQTLTVNNASFMQNIWSNVKDISAANRNFVNVSAVAVVGVRPAGAKLPTDLPDSAAEAECASQESSVAGLSAGLPDGVVEIERADLERSIAELQKIIANSALSDDELSCYLYFLGACQVQLGDIEDGRKNLEEARQKADPDGLCARLTTEELAR
jgi:hypothetical protein